MTIGQMIKQARQSKNLSQKQLAEKLGVSASMIGQYENDLRKPKIERLAEIATALDIDISILESNKEQEDITNRLFRLICSGRSSTKSADIVDNELKYYFSKTNHLRKRLLDCFDNLLNNEGQQKAIERIEELAEIPKYKKEPPQD